MAEAAVTEPLKYKTWNLKVSIHCEGCKRKVKKVLQSVEGVYTTTVDSQKQKVTVTGNIEAEALIKKLIKAGKHAEPWPEPKPSKPNSSGNSNDNGGGKKKNKKNKNKDGDQPDGESLVDKPETKETEPDNKGEEEGGKGPAGAESGKDLATEAPKTEKPAGKKKGKKNNNGGGNANDNSSSSSNNNGNKVAPAQDNQQAAVVPSQQGNSLVMCPLPQYVVSYSNMQPVMAGSYYIPTGTTMAAAMAGSYDFFSEENANACVVM